MTALAAYAAKAAWNMMNDPPGTFRTCMFCSPYVNTNRHRRRNQLDEDAPKSAGAAICGLIVITVDRSWMVAIIGGVIVLGGTVLYFVLPQPKFDPPQEAIYCTAGMATCITEEGSPIGAAARTHAGQWYVLAVMCPAGQTLQFVSVEARRCHSITPAGFSTPLSVCPAACAQ